MWFEGRRVVGVRRQKAVRWTRLSFCVMHTQRQFSLLTLVLVVTAIAVWFGLLQWLPDMTGFLTVTGILAFATVLLIRTHRRIAIAFSATICGLSGTLALWAWTTHWKWERQGAYAHNSFPMNKLARDLTLVTCVYAAIVAMAWILSCFPRGRRRATANSRVGQRQRVSRQRRPAAGRSRLLADSELDGAVD